MGKEKRGGRGTIRKAGTIGVSVERHTSVIPPSILIGSRNTQEKNYQEQLRTTLIAQKECRKHIRDRGL